MAELMQALLLLALVALVFGFIKSGDLLIALSKANPAVWKKNREATQLCRKYNKGTLTQAEGKIFDRFVAHGTVKISGLAVNTKTNAWVVQARLTHAAVEDLFT